MQIKPLLALLATLLFCSTSPAHAQEPRLGRYWYEDAVDIGFKFKAPKGWDFVPAQPGEVGTIGKYVGPGSQFLAHPKTGEPWDYSLYMMVCGNPFLLGAWDFNAFPFWPTTLLRLRDLAVLFCLASGVAFFAAAARREWRWQRQRASAS